MSDPIAQELATMTKRLTAAMIAWNQGDWAKLTEEAKLLKRAAREVEEWARDLNAEENAERSEA